MKTTKAFFALIIIGMIAAVSAGAQPVPSGEAFRQEGIASWYGNEFNGRPTASGEIFDSTQFTAAHRNLTFGSFVIVTNTHNNKKVRVRINDRGPFVASRIIDLSKAAAEALDMVSTGTAPVVVEMSNQAAIGPVSYDAAAPSALPAEITAAVPAPEISVPVQNTAPTEPAVLSPPAVTSAPVPSPVAAIPAAVTPVPSAAVPSAVPAVAVPAPTPAPAASIPAEPVFAPAVTAVSAAPPPAAGPKAAAAILGGIPPAGTGKSYRLQVGSYRIPRNAVEAFERLKNSGLNPAYEQNNDMYRVVVAGLKPEEIPSVAEILMTAGFAEALIREER